MAVQFVPGFVGLLLVLGYLRHILLFWSTSTDSGEKKFGEDDSNAVVQNDKYMELLLEVHEDEEIENLELKARASKVSRLR